jgi:DNA polymerase V
MQPIPLYTGSVPAGFASPIEDHLDKQLDLNEFMIAHPSATFFVKVEGDSMIGAGIHSGDMLVVDRALEARSEQIVLAVIHNEFTVKRLRKEKGRIFLYPENPRYQPIEILENMDFSIWGVVTFAIHKL